MKTYVIGNLKGGTGKTTTAVNLGYSMSLLGQKVLLIDADPQSNLTPFFVRANQRGMTLRDVFLHPEKIRRAVRRSKYENIDIIKGNTRLKEADVLGEMVLTEALNLISDRYDICLIDTRPAFEAITRSALYAADVLLTPVLLDKFCRDNLLLVEDSIDLFGDALEWKIVANKVENRRSQRNIYADMVGMHSWPFLETCISKGAVVDNALELYKPVKKHRHKSVVATDYMDLAKELLEG